MIITLKNNSETSFATFLLDFISVSEMLVHSDYVFVLVIVKTVVRIIIKDTVVRLCTTWLRVHAVVLLLLSFFNWEEVDLFILKDFSLFYVPEELSKQLEGFISTHWKTCVYVTCSCAVLFMSQGWQFRIDQFSFLGRNNSLCIDWRSLWSISLCIIWFRTLLRLSDRVQLVFRHVLVVHTILDSVCSCLVCPWTCIWAILIIEGIWMSIGINWSRSCSWFFICLSLIL